jgi:hypothetical protein
MALVTAPAFSQSADADDSNADAKPSWYNAWFNLTMPEHPWYFGIAGGYTKNTLYQGGAENYRPKETWEGADGWTLSLAARYQIFNWLAVQAEPTYITKNYRWRGQDIQIDTNVYDHEFNWTTNGFIDLPLLVNLSSGWGSDASRIRVSSQTSASSSAYGRIAASMAKPRYWRIGIKDMGRSMCFATTRACMNLTSGGTTVLTAGSSSAAGFNTISAHSALLPSSATVTACPTCKNSISRQVLAPR